MQALSLPYLFVLVKPFAYYNVTFPFLFFFSSDNEVAAVRTVTFNIKNATRYTPYKLF